MASHVTYFALFTLALLVTVECCGSPSPSPSPSTCSGPTNTWTTTGLYNSCVKYAQKCKRPLLSSAGDLLRYIGIYHKGVVVTLENDERWLIHKGNEYGTLSETVAVRAWHMSSAWSTDGSRKSIRYSDVGDYVSAGGSHYSLATDNCPHAARRMMNLN